jgi:hypothetical protein
MTDDERKLLVFVARALLEENRAMAAPFGGSRDVEELTKLIERVGSKTATVDA